MAFRLALAVFTLGLQLTVAPQAGAQTKQCPRGYRTTAEGCVMVQIPANGELTALGNDWKCRRGYRREGSGCSVVAIPVNGELAALGNDWKCRRGYRREGSGCSAVAIPVSGELTALGNDWKCRRGYRREGSGCSVVAIPVNGELTALGNDWKCNRGFKRANDACAAMTEQELAQAGRMEAEVARLLALEATVTEQEGTVEGERAEVVIKTRGCRDYFVADGPSGYYLLEWYGGYEPSRGDIIIGKINGYGFKDVYYPGHGRGRVYVDDYLLSKSRAQEKYFSKCQ